MDQDSVDELAYGGQFGLCKDCIKEVKRSKKTGSPVKLEDILKKKGLDIDCIGSKKNKFVIKKGLELNGGVFGYAEGKYEDGQILLVEGGIIIDVSLEYMYPGQMICYTFPIYYTIGVSGELNEDIILKDIRKLPDGSLVPVWEGMMSLDIPVFEAGAGIGVHYLAQVGLGGKAGLSFEVPYGIDKKPEAYLTGEALFEIKFFGFSMVTKLLGGKFPFKLLDYDKTDQETRLRSVSESLYSSIDIHAPVKPDERYDTEKISDWTGNQAEFTLRSETGNRDSERVLEINTYPDAEPQIMEADGKKVMIWLTDNRERSAYNKSMLVYSVYQEADDTWSAPQAVLDDGRADYYPAIKNGFIVWQKAKQEFNEGVSLAEIGKASEIYVAEFNGDYFGTPVRLTDNDVMDAQPQIAVNGDQAVVVWTQNSDNNVLGNTGRNAIYQSIYDGSSWSGGYAVCDNLNAITHLSAGYMGGYPVIAFVSDMDNSPDTIDDREIFIIKDGKVSRFTNNLVMDSNPVFSEINGAAALFWYSGGSVCYTTDLEQNLQKKIAKDSQGYMTDDYSVISNGNNAAVIWAEARNGSSEVHGMFYDGAQWNGDSVITHTGKEVRYPDGMMEEDGRVILAFHRLQDSDADTAGCADLCVTELMPAYDLEISSVLVGDDPAPDTQVPVYVTVTNSGQLPVTGITAELFDADGIVNDMSVTDCTLAAGQTMELLCSYHIKDEVKTGDIAVIVNALSGQDLNPENNKASVPVGQSDLKIADISSTKAGFGYQVSVILKNAGYAVAEGNDLKICQGNENGDAVIQIPVDDMAAQEEKTIVLTLDETVFSQEEKEAVFTAVVSTHSKESWIGNNYQGFYIARSKSVAGGNSAPGGTNPTVPVNQTDNGKIIPDLPSATENSEGKDTSDHESDSDSVQKEQMTDDPQESQKEQQQIQNEHVKVRRLKIIADTRKIAVGKKVRFTVKISPSNASDKKVKWKSGNKKYASVNKDGVVTAKKAGKGKKVKITAHAKDGSRMKASVWIKIMPNAVTKVRIKDAKKTIKAGKTLQLHAIVQADGKKANKVLAWTSSNPDYAVVNSKGKVTAKKAGKGKKVIITASSTDGSHRQSKIRLKIK